MHHSYIQGKRDRDKRWLSTKYVFSKEDNEQIVQKWDSIWKDPLTKEDETQ